MRTKAFQLRKVRGDCNPPDLLTKHIPTQGKLEQLVHLFGGEFRSGRAKSAPLLRRRDEPQVGVDEDVEVDIIEGLDEHGEVVVQEAGRHDISKWPHLHSDELMEKLFPIVIAAPDAFAEDEAAMGEHESLYQRWAAMAPSGGSAIAKMNKVCLVQG